MNAWIEPTKTENITTEYTIWKFEIGVLNNDSNCIESNFIFLIFEIAKLKDTNEELTNHTPITDQFK